MLSRSAFTRIYTQYFGLVLRIVRICGFRGQDAYDAAHEVFENLWEKRDSWPAVVDSEKSYIAKFALLTGKWLQRRSLTQKRKPKGPSTFDPAEWAPAPRLEDVWTTDADQEAPLLAEELRDAMLVILAHLPEEHREVLRARLDAEDEDSVSARFGKRRVSDALRALRRLVGIPPRRPEAADVDDEAEFIVEAARRLTERDLGASSMNNPNPNRSSEEEDACAADPYPKSDRDPRALSAPRASSEASSGRKRPTATVMTRAFRRPSGGSPSASASANSPSPRSPPPSSACDNSPRRAPSRQPSGAKGPATSLSPDELASAPTLIKKIVPKYVDETTSTEQPHVLLIDEEPSFSGGDL